MSWDGYLDPMADNPQMFDARDAEIARLRAERDALRAQVERLTVEIAETNLANAATDHNLAHHLAPFLAVAQAVDRCEGGRGAFSCCPPHDCRCPKSRADTPEQWKGEWVCVCGREELDRALAHPLVQARLKEARDAC